MQPIFNEVNRDRGSRLSTDAMPRGEVEFTQTIPRREGRRRSQPTKPKASIILCHETSLGDKTIRDNP